MLSQDTSRSGAACLLTGPRIAFSFAMRRVKSDLPELEYLLPA
jgi:hypothetical protein